MPANLENSAVATGLEKASFHSNPKERQCLNYAQRMLLPMNIHNWFPLGWTGLISLRSTGLSSLLQYHSSKASIPRCSAFFMIQLSHPYMTTGKTKALTRQTFVGKVMSLLFNMLSRLVIAFLPRSKRLLILKYTRQTFSFSFCLPRKIPSSGNNISCSLWF